MDLVDFVEFDGETPVKVKDWEKIETIGNDIEQRKSLKN